VSVDSLPVTDFTCHINTEVFCKN